MVRLLPGHRVTTARGKLLPSHRFSSADVPAVPVPSAGVMAFYGDSFAEGSSGGGGIEAYQSLQPTVRRYLLATGTGYRTENKALTGSSCTYARSQWLARTVHRQYNYICTGRNDAAMTASQILAVIDDILADQKPGEIIILGSVHNFNNGTEAAGSAAHTKWLAVNAGLAARANGSTIFYADHRTEAVHEHNLLWQADIDRAALDQPSQSLTVSASDALHLNTQGCEMQARLIIEKVLEYRGLADPRPNLLTNADFSNGTTGWHLNTDTTATPDAGGVAITGTGAFKGVAQNVLASGAAGRKFFALMDVSDLDPAGGNSYTMRLRQSATGGTVYANRDETYPRDANAMFLAAEPTQAALAFQVEAINNGGLTFHLGGLRVHEAYPQTITNYAPINTTPPSLSGIPSIGAPITGDLGGWDAYPDATLTFRWLADGVDLEQASLTWTPGAELEGQDLVLEVTATNSEGPTVESTQPVTILPPQPLIFDTFDSGIEPWVAGTNNAPSHVNGRLRVQNNGAGWTITHRNGPIPVENGQQYKLTYDFIRTSHNGKVRIGWVYNAENIPTVRSASGSYEQTFTAGGSSLYLSLQCDTSSATGFCDWDNIKLEKV